MGIISLVNKNIEEIKNQVQVPLDIKTMKPIVFIDNINFKNTENPLAIVHLELFDAKDVIELRSRMNNDDIFNLVNMIDESTVYCVWGDVNVEEIKSSLIEWGYDISNKTTFLDLKKESTEFFGRDFDTFEDVVEAVFEDRYSLDLIFNTKESVMYSLLLEMCNNGYDNGVITASIEDLINNAEKLYRQLAYKGESFREQKSSIELLESELVNLSTFVDKMSEYNSVMNEQYTAIINNESMPMLYRNMLMEKAMLCRFKIDTYKYLRKLLNIYEKENFDAYKFNLKATELYTVMEDAYVLSQDVEDDKFGDFVKELGNSFNMSTAVYANSFILRKNIINTLRK